MPTETWGMLAKSAVDDETIEEAIARLILAHNEDETAHLDTGQSLQSHKAAAIIDHLALSIIEDKLENGCVTSDKITSDQVVGKDIRTDIDVGEDVDGVKMTSSGIEMWQDSEKKVDIPVTGDPYFAGDLIAGRILLSRPTAIFSGYNIDSFYIEGASSLLGVDLVRVQSASGDDKYVFVWAKAWGPLMASVAKNFLLEGYFSIWATNNPIGRFGVGSYD